MSAERSRVRLYQRSHATVSSLASRLVLKRYPMQPLNLCAPNSGSLQRLVGRLWRRVKHERVYPEACDPVDAARTATADLHDLVQRRASPFQPE